MAEEKVYSVQELNDKIMHAFQEEFPRTVCVQGEVTDFKGRNAKSGHYYFSIKENGKDVYGREEINQLSCAVWSSIANRILTFDLKNGQQVKLYGEIGLYRPRGTYSFQVTGIEKVDELGELYRQFLLVREKLEKAGMFRKEHKKPIPAYPKRIGVVTAEGKDAIRDIQINVRKKNPYVQVILLPAQVQGDGAVESIVQGIAMLDAIGVDFIVVGRGGGAIEDLAAFNDETLAEAIFAAETPIVSAVGHEKDVTIADFVADKRVSTPTAVAELVPDVRQTLQELAAIKRRMQQHCMYSLNRERSRLELFTNKLQARSPMNQLQRRREQTDAYRKELVQAMNRRMQQYRNRYAVLLARIDAAAPSKKLAQGYGYLETEGRMVRSVQDVAVGSTLTVTMQDGCIQADVTEINAQE